MKTHDAIQHFGTAAELARRLGIDRRAVYQWGETVPALRALQIEELTRGKLKANRKELFARRRPAPVATDPA